MRDFILRVYVKARIFVWNLQILYKIYLFGKYLYKDRVLHNGNPKDVLKVLQKFTEEAWAEYPDKRVMGRTPVQSAALLGVLIRHYYDSGSNIILNQIMQVLRTEFIEREKNGGK